MGKLGKVNMKELKDFQKELKKLQNPNKFVEACTKELAARLLRMVVKRTPVGDYSGNSYSCSSGIGISHQGNKVKGKNGGTLRHGWTAQKEGNGSEGLKTNGVSQFVDTLSIHHFGDTYVVEIINPVWYAPYVEYGHRTANHRGWVPGHFMMTISEQELETIAPKVLELKIKKYFEGFIR